MFEPSVSPGVSGMTGRVMGGRDVEVVLPTASSCTSADVACDAAVCEDEGRRFTKAFRRDVVVVVVVVLATSIADEEGRVEEEEDGAEEPAAYGRAGAASVVGNS